MKQAMVAIAIALAAACGKAPAEAQSKSGLREPASSGSPGSAALHLAEGAAVPGSYLVRLKAGASADGVLRRHALSARHSYTLIHGFAANLSAAQLAAVRSDPSVSFVEEDQVFTADAVQYNPDWGLDRIDQTYLPLDGAFYYTYDGTGVNAYVIDTGITSGHPDFGGRASAVYDALGGTGEDCNGHGTHVAGTIGGSTYGVAKNATLRALRVLDCNGSGSTSGIIAALNWLATNGARPGVANMSLGGGFSQSLNDAVNNLAASGIFVAVAAGNSSANACNYSPASAANATTVAASDINDNHAYYSNYGGCVDLYGPGTSITSDWLNNGTNTISGTSMATPHVVGVAALYKQAYGDAAFTVLHDWLVANASANVINGSPAGTPNRLLFTGGL